MTVFRHGRYHQLGTPLLALATGLINQELLLQNEYLAAENRIDRLASHA